MAVLNVRHVGIVVRDLELMLHFYVDLLGFRVVSRCNEPADVMDELMTIIGVRLVTVKLAAPGGSLIELLHFASHPPTEMEPRWLSDAGLSHFALTVSNIEAEYERLCRARVEFLSAPRVAGSAKIAFAVDPEGGFVELVEVLH